MASVFNGAIGNYAGVSNKNDRIWYQWTSNNSITVSNQTGYIDTWRYWNQQVYQTTATTNVYIGNGNDWVWLNQGTGSNTIRWQPTWDGWNDSYVESAEERRARQLHQWGTTARSTARYPERYAAERYAQDLDALLAAVRVDVGELTAEEERTLTDFWQRGIEEHREDLRQAELARIAREEREALAAEANRRAELLLLSLLSHEQKEEWLEHRRVTEVAPSGRVWRLFPKWAGAACLMEGNVRRATLCLHPLERVPEADVMASILVGLQGGQEEHYIKIAILHSGDWTEEERQIRAGAKVERRPAPDGQGYVHVAA